MIKVYRDEPEFPGAPLTATIPEDTLQSAMDNGWKVEKKAEVKAEPKVEPKVEEPKAEEKPKAKKKLD